MRRKQITKRGFIVHKLELVLDNVAPKNEGDTRDCKKTALNCKCPYHGIFVRWKLGLSRVRSGGGDYLLARDTCDAAPNK